MLFKPRTVVVLLTAFCFVPCAVPTNMTRNISKPTPRSDITMCVIFEQKCSCWIGFHGRKLYDFGTIGRFAAVLGSQWKCKTACRRKTSLDKNRLCRLLNRTAYHVRLEWFSKLEATYTPLSSGLLASDLCCKKPRKCQMSNGLVYKKHNMCVKKLVAGCIHGVSAGNKNPPVCCLKSSLTGRLTTYGCQPVQKHRAKSVACYRDKWNLMTTSRPSSLG